METQELLKKVRQIEIKTRGIVDQLFSGEYHSVFKGRGIEFSEVREYQFGDDIRTIDWNVSARFNHPYVKIFEEERELTVMLLVDFSKSAHYGTVNQLKNDIAVEICACLAFSAIKNNDKVGAILFTNEIEKFIPPKKGKSHILRILRELLFFKPKGTMTNIRNGLEYFNKVMKKKSIAFLLSDFYDTNFEEPLRIVSRKHDLIAIHLIDPTEMEIPKIGIAKFVDAETGNEIWVDAGNEEVRKKYKKYWISEKQRLDRLFLTSKVDKINIHTNKPYYSPIVDFFKLRERRY
jgi:uncharacterized protein (DUF58 family)